MISPYCNLAPLIQQQIATQTSSYIKLHCGGIFLLSKLCFFGPKYRLRLFPMDGTPMAHTYLQRFSYIAKVPHCRVGGRVPPPPFLVQSWRKTVFRTPDVCPPLTHACLGARWGAVFPRLGPDLAAKRPGTFPQVLAWTTMAVWPPWGGAISRKTSKMAT